MSFVMLLSLFSFSLVMSISPGPVNILILTSSLNNGFNKTFSFISGATIGFTLLLVLIGLGFNKIFSSYAFLFSYLEIAGAIFIFYMGYTLLSSNSEIKIDKKDKRLLKFHEGFLLQWLNPKAWIACLSGTSMFVNNNETLLIFALMYFVVCYSSLSLWGILGQKASIFLNTKQRIKKFNILMGLVLIFLALYIVLF